MTPPFRPGQFAFVACAAGCSPVQLIRPNSPFEWVAVDSAGGSWLIAADLVYRTEVGAAFRSLLLDAIGDVPRPPG